MKIIPCLLLSLSVISCTQRESQDNTTDEKSPEMNYTKGTFGYDLDFLRQYHQDLVVLRDADDKAQLIISPGYQGRVMTSTANGKEGNSFGWVNHDLIASGKQAPHIHAVGGEERFWLGPEGGQFSIYFKKGVEFTFDNWFVPKEIDTEPFTLVSSTSTEARFEKEMHLENYSGNRFDLLVNRNIRLLNKSTIDSLLGVSLPADMEVVGFESENILTNKGTTAWTKKTGLLSIWILSMLNASEKTTVAIPYKQGEDSKLGKIVTDDYFGKVPAERLVVKDGLLFFKADGQYRSKIGISPQRALPIVASYDAINNVLTIAKFSLPGDAADYVNSLWQIQEEPYKGDAINSYNDGPVNGGQMGKLYELESSSPAAALAPNESLTHKHSTVHIKGKKEDLDKIAIKLLGVSVDAISL